MARLIAIAIAFFQTVSLHYGTLPKSEIERRVRSYENSNSKREQKLRRLFEEAGCTVNEQPVKHSKVPNLICTLSGETDTEIIVGGHFDFVDSGHGVIDNWTGCSALAELISKREGQATAAYFRVHRLYR
jgi:hypothetical protein